MGIRKKQFTSAQSLSHVQLSPAQWTAAFQASLSITNIQNLLKFLSIKSVMPSNHLILSQPLLSPSIFPSVRVFSNESFLCIRWPQFWSFSFSISASNEYSRLISFRMDWLDLLAVQGTLKSLLQYHSSKASILWHSAFFIVQLSHLYLTAGKTIAMTRFSSVTQSCPTLCDPMNCSTPGLPVYHHLSEFTQTRVHRVSDAIQPSHPQLSPSPPAPNPSQHQSLFQ